MIKTHRIEIKYFCFLLLVASLFTGCNSSGVTEKTITSEQALTSVALTVDSKLITVNEVTITPSLTPTPAPSLTATPTISPSSTVGSTPSQTPQSVNPPAPTTCDNAAFVSDVTIPDGTQLSPGDVFTKTWRIQNSGTCTWTSDYAVAFASGTIMDATTPIALAVDTVLPGATVDISVGMVAPETAGQYTGYWRMQNASGVDFGVTFFVDILVTSSAGTQESTLESTPSATATSITATPTRTRRVGPKATPTP
jgi:hypothetical protein